MGYSNLIPNDVIEFSSNVMAGTQGITTVAGDKGLTDIVLPSIILGHVYHAYLDVVFSMVGNTFAGVNETDGNQYIQIAVNGDYGTPHNAILIPDAALRCPASSNIAYGRIYGNIDLAGLFNPGDTLNVFWNDAKSIQDALVLYNCQSIIRMVVG